MEIARWHVIQSIIGYFSFLERRYRLQNDSLRQKSVPQSILTVEGVISINNSKNLKQEKKT